MTLKQVVGISDFSGINRVGVDSSGRLLVNLGGASVTVDISGDPVTISGNAVTISGNSITVSGPVLISGQVVNASGTVVNISGATVNTINIGLSTTVIRTASGVKCTSLSGGVAFPSLVGDRVVITANSDNSGKIYLGSTTNPPFSGHGLHMGAGATQSFTVTNANVFQAFASTSGDIVSVIVEDY